MLVADLDNFLSHPDKKLVAHIEGVVNGVRKRTDSKIAELSAIFHDFGKLYPNFQEKLKTGKSRGYSNHTYLSGYLFLCYCKENFHELVNYLGGNENWISSIFTIIVSHHKNLGDYPMILSDTEIDHFLTFLDNRIFCPASDLLANFLSHNKFDLNIPYKEKLLKDLPIQLCIKSQRAIANSEQDALGFFLETQFSFASLIAADKEDASHFHSTSDLDIFCKSFNSNLDNYISKFKNDTELNMTRTNIRQEAKANLAVHLENNNRIFSLTSPTGSGKTLILLTLAGEILRQKGNFRIIYALPFLSITEQIEEICVDIFKNNINSIARIDSKTENKLFSTYQKELDSNPDVIDKIINTQFADDFFDHPFIITTFVKLFETLLSNKNSELLKLPNFSNAIFLIDEIQSLPPRLYGFFISFLDTFCKKFNSYAIISTATMPNFELPSNNIHNLNKFFNNFSVPPELVTLKYFNSPVFNRYQIITLEEKIEIDELASLIIKEDTSVLVILNTIDDTNLLYNKLCEQLSTFKIILLNTHFTPLDRSKKIQVVKWYLKRKVKVILISTQLIEAGVDIDFPVVYRDIAPLPNIVQSAGRGNRNGQMNGKAKIVIFQLTRNECIRASLIYKGPDKDLLTFSINTLKKDSIYESELLELQKEYFKFTQANLIFGKHKDVDLIQAVQEVAFNRLGQFQLIDSREYGEEIKYYIPHYNNDNEFEKLEQLYKELLNIQYKEFRDKKVKWIEIENQIRKMSGRIIQIRLKSTDEKPIPDKDPCFSINKLSEGYNSRTGIDLSNVNQIL